MKAISTGLQTAALAVVLAACAFAECIPALLGLTLLAGCLEWASCRLSEIKEVKR